MAFSGREYADRVRELREQGYNLPASNGYVLRNAAQWSTGQKAAVTRLYNQLQDDLTDTGADFPSDDVQLSDADFAERREVYYNAGIGEEFETEGWDELDYLDFEEIDDFGDEESDTYAEDT